MKREQALSFLKKLGSDLPMTQARTGWSIGTCPLGPWRHDEGKSSPEVFGIKADDGDSFCHCFSCGWSGSQSDLIIEMKRLNKASPSGKLFPFGELLQLIADAEDTSELEGLESPDIEEMLFGAKPKFHIYPEWWLDTFMPFHEAPFAIKYLQKRGVAQGIAELLDIRADTKEKRICFPIRNFKGELMGLHGRAVEDGVEPRYRMYTHDKVNNPLIWMNEQNIDFDKPVITVEGPLDLASVMRVYRNVTSPLFSNPNLAKWKRMGDAEEMITFYDRGTGGDLGRKKAETAMGSGSVTHVIPPEGCKDPGAMSVQQVAEALHGIVPLDEIIC
jgi:hypothetical protein